MVVGDSGNWKAIENLKEPFNDAVNYRARAEKEFFNKIFLRTDELQRCLDAPVYFLIGEKGTGKTAYATYVENNSPNKVLAKVITITETQYKRFVELKKQGKLSYSDFGNIWRAILLVVVSQVIIDKSKGFLAGLTGKFSKIEAILKQWNQNSLNPEIDVALETIRSSKLAAKAGQPGIGSLSTEDGEVSTVKLTEIRHGLLESELALKTAIQQLKLSQDHIVFIDGIDYRPESISYSDYLNCVKGLGEALWQLNVDFFKGIKDSTGRIKIVLLVRPDVFHALNLNNSNSRIQDNSVFLDWSTTDKGYVTSKLFEACDKYFASQQEIVPELGMAWRNYFPSPESFKRLLRISFHKPRDLLTFIKILRAIHIKRKAGGKSSFNEALLTDPEFSREVADYLLGEVRNYAAFYMTQEDFSAYLKFFQYLDGKASFDMVFFRNAFDRFSTWASGEPIRAREFAKDPESLLQFFYDVNVMGFKEATGDASETFIHWSFRERTLNNISPKVKSLGTLVINPGIAKALEIGKNMKPTHDGAPQPRRPAKRRRGHRRNPQSS